MSQSKVNSTSDESDAESTPLISSNATGNSIKDKFNRCGCNWWTILSAVFPCVQWIPKYNWKWLQCDLIAGLTVGLTVIPQGLAYAQIAGLPVQYGLYTAFMGGFIYCLLGTSKDITLGPTAIMSLLVHQYGDHDPVQVIILTLLGGCIQLVMGVLRLGFVMRYLSVPVVSGFTSAAAITIGFGQVKHIIGVKTDSDSFIPEVIETFKKIPNGNVWDVVVGLCCIILLLLMKFSNRGMPTGPNDTKCQSVSKTFMWFVATGRNAIIVICAGAVAYAIHTQHITTCKVTDCITRTGEITKGLPSFKPPAFSEVQGNATIHAGQLIQRIGVGLAVVPLMGFLESIAIGKAFARKGGYTLNINQEMIAIGVANIASSFVSSYTITGSFSRTAINHQSNVKTPAGGIFTGVLVIVGLGLLTPSFAFIPKAALAAVIISAVVFMVDIATVRRLWHARKLDLIPLIVTFLVCFWQIPYGILAGIGISLLMLLYPVSFPGVKIASFVPVTGDNSSKECLTVSIQTGLNYPSAEFIYNKVKEEVLKRESISAVIMDFQHISSIDFTVSQTISELADDLQRLGIQLAIVSVQEDIRDTLVKTAKAGSIQFYKDDQEAMSIYSAC